MVIPAYFLFIMFAFVFYSLENHDLELFLGDLGKIQVVIDVIRSFVSGQTIKLNLKREIAYIYIIDMGFLSNVRNWFSFHVLWTGMIFVEEILSRHRIQDMVHPRRVNL